MPSVRIYAFAKELGLDNKQLLDICESCGIKGKGSALASLDDDEIAKIKKHMTEGSSVATATEPPPEKPAPIREAPLPPKQPAAPMRKDSILNRKPDAGVRDLNQRKKPNPENQDKSKAEKKEPRKKGGLNVKLAQMPNVKQPEPGQSEPAEKVQKPDIALPQDAIAKARSGAAPLEHLTRQKTDKPKKKGRGGSTQPANQSQIFGEMPNLGSGRKGGRRGEKSQDENKESNTGLGSTRQQRTKRKRIRPGMDSGDDRPYYNRRNRHRSGPVANTAAPRKEEVELQLPCTVREFSEAAGVPAVKVLLTTKQLGDETNRNINSALEDEMVELLIEHLGISLKVKQAESLEESVLSDFEREDDPSTLEARPPIVTFLGHVDHGKTSLLDAIIGINVVSGEAGGITQHIRAYEIHKGDQKIAFVDTPGHEAFTEMRARGANVTDIAVLVVAADDGVMPQTEEAISHIKAAGVPIIVALNKIDLPGANPDKALQDLAQHELLPSEWGGDIEVVRTSATKGTGMDELLETILVTAELHEYQANHNRAAQGTCLEAEQQAGEGVMAKLMVQNGTLKIGDVIVCGSAHGRVKAMYDTLRGNVKMEEAGPSTPINLTGLDIAPGAGDKFYVLDDIAKAREIAASRENESRQQSLSGFTTKVSLEEIQRRMETGDLRDPNAEVITLNLIIRADVRGSIEAIQKELGKISHPEIQIKILQALVGGVTVADVRLAQASEAVIIGFNVVPDEAARSLADDLQVEVRRYDIIYKVTDDLKAMLEGRLKPEEQVVELGMAMVLQTFNISKTGTIAGCRVMRGSIHRDCRIRVIRESRIIGDYPIDSLKRVKDDAKEVQRGMECGIKLVGFNDIKEGDTLEAYKIEEVARTL
ncbi:MAG: translation initiation factor IF-2 [Planctomycetota bacterium]